MQAPWLCTKRWDSSREDSSAHVRSGVPRGELMDRWRTQISTDLLIRHRKSGKTFLTQYLVDLKTVTMVLVIIVLKMLNDWGHEKWGYNGPWQSWTRRNLRRRFLGLSRNPPPLRCHAIFLPHIVAQSPSSAWGKKNAWRAQRVAEPGRVTPRNIG